MAPLRLLYFCLFARFSISSSLRVLDQSLNCGQPGLDHCKLDNCSREPVVVPRHLAPTGPELQAPHMDVATDGQGLVLVLNITWRLKSDAGVLMLRGSQINIVDESTNESICIRFIYNISQQLNPEFEKWMFQLGGIVVEAGRTYTLELFNLPEPDVGDYRAETRITIPGCDNSRIQGEMSRTEMRLEGGQWDPRASATVLLGENHVLHVILGFQAAEYSDRYQVSIQSDAVSLSKNVSKVIMVPGPPRIHRLPVIYHIPIHHPKQENRTSLNVTFRLDLLGLSTCKMVLKIKPFFLNAKNDCWRVKKITVDCCPQIPQRSPIIKGAVLLVLAAACLAYLLWRSSRQDPLNSPPPAAGEQLQGFQVQRRRRVLVVYSHDHYLYRNIVLKLCAFLGAKCGVEAVLDLLDFHRLGVLGSVQWLDWHRERMESSSDKILVLCSRGVQAKWKAMCGDRRVVLREDVLSPMGDTLTPALSLIVPCFVRYASYQNYIVAYFEDVCSEEDIPFPFHITVRYKLMKQFEELIFRILDAEKQEPGKVVHIEGLAENEYHRCPTGRALRDAIEAFRVHQRERPRWFDEVLLQNSDSEV